MKDGLGNGTGMSGVVVEHTGDLLLSSSAKLYFRDSGLFIQSDADGSIIISSDSNVKINASGTSGNTVKITLGDKAGNSNFAVLDSDNFPMSQLDSDGNLKQKGVVKKTLTN